ncbi:DUF4139 domain-containing protein [Xinfangfangia sp. D13-10-4-6]|uniref:DUF4139 domain-containing protein n=1 Tax=Pseudogemmobacter hezensis TaxID=2737662 RepID=UPI001551FD41|nr:DUF4139 domain-containing protein [Pseudogemmobacter hezensis]NPD15559.1 DUF4139 domain-containing protein [Pseudogemmobacter hezensis]
MRAALAALLVTTALPAFADTITATSTITDVTVYPQGAKVTREVRFESPSAGVHELLVTDLPQYTEARSMRVIGADGVTTGAFSLRDDRLPPRPETLSPAQTEAKAAVDAARADLREANAQVEEVQSRIGAANARMAYLASISGQPGENASVESLRDFAKVIGEETLAASREAAQARKDLWPVQEALEAAQKRVNEAEATLAALPGPDQNYTALVAALETGSAGEKVITISHFVDQAGWRPFYDLHLNRKDRENLQIERSVLVTQYSGEDWSGVSLTLSSSRPSEQASPSHLWPVPRRIVSADELAKKEARSREAYADMPAAEVMMAAGAPEPGPAPISAVAGLEGDTVVYAYPRKVDIATGVEDLRLSLDRIGAEAEIRAVAVPARDRTAFVMAKFTNGSGEPLLPGEALLYREGVLVGGYNLALTAAGAEAEIPFGAIDGLVLRRDMPQRDSGQTGVFTTSNQQSETAILRIENLTGESWPVEVIDQVPYSEQADLKIATEISPRPTRTDPDGQRGLLAWDFELEPGKIQEISLGYTLSWPSGMVLQ